MLDEIINNIPRANWIQSKEWLTREAAKHKLSRHERERINQDLVRAIRAGTSKSATNWLAIGVIFDGDDFVDRARREGVAPLRAKSTAATPGAHKLHLKPTLATSMSGQKSLL